MIVSCSLTHKKKKKKGELEPFDEEGRVMVVEMVQDGDTMSSHVVEP